MISALVLAAASAGAPKPVRSLSYTFTAAGASAPYTGTVTADVLGGTKDGALVVRFSQTADGSGHTYAPAVCWVYGDTRVSCNDPKALSPVETELAHLLGRGFVDGNNLDANNHWRIAGSMGASTVTDDFTVTANNNGILAITEAREITGAGASKHDAQISYDMNRTVPLSVHYTQTGDAASTVDLKLASDSLQTAKPAKP